MTDNVVKTYTFVRNNEFEQIKSGILKANEGRSIGGGRDKSAPTNG